MELETRRTAPPEVRTKQILDAARVCFIRAGFAATKVSDIAHEAGVSVGLIYRHFPSKTAVMTAIVSDEARRQLRDLVSPVGRPGDSRRLTVDNLIDAMREALHDRDRVLLMLEATTAMIRDDDLRRAVESIQLDQAQAVASQLAPVLDGLVGNEEMGKRLQVLAGLASGLAIQISVAPHTKREVSRLFDESARAIFAGHII